MSILVVLRPSCQKTDGTAFVCAGQGVRDAYVPCASLRKHVAMVSHYILRLDALPGLSVRRACNAEKRRWALEPFRTELQEEIEFMNLNGSAPVARGFLYRTVRKPCVNPQVAVRRR